MDEYQSSWSHGAGGIGLFRLELLKNNILFSDINVETDLKNALKNITLKGFFEGDESLIFGRLGNIELLISYVLHFKDEKIKAILDDKIESILSRLESLDFHDSSLSINSLGLMTGLTGTAFQLLRYLYPKEIPSILLTE